MPTVKILHSFACAGAMVLSGCATTLLPSLDDIANGQAYSVAPPDAPSGAAVDAFARTFLNEIQPASCKARPLFGGSLPAVKCLPRNRGKALLQATTHTALIAFILMTRCRL